MEKFLIIEVQSTSEISTSGVDAITSTLRSPHYECEHILSPGIFHSLSLLNIALESKHCDGIILCGCILEKNNMMQNIEIQECIRGIGELAVFYSLPFVNGLLLVKNYSQGLAKIIETNKKIAEDCLCMLKIRDTQYNYANSDDSLLSCKIKH